MLGERVPVLEQRLDGRVGDGQKHVDSLSPGHCCNLCGVVRRAIERVGANAPRPHATRHARE